MEILNKKERIKSILKFLGIWVVGLISIAWAERSISNHSSTNDTNQNQWSRAAKNQFILISKLDEILTLKDNLLDLAVKNTLIEQTSNLKSKLDSLFMEFSNFVIVDSLNVNNSKLATIVESKHTDSIIDQIKGLNEKPKEIYIEGGKQMVTSDKYKTPYFKLKEKYNNLESVVNSIKRLKNQAKASGISEKNDIYNAFDKINESLSSYRKI